MGVVARKAPHSAQCPFHKKPLGCCTWGLKKVRKGGWLCGVSVLAGAIAGQPQVK